MEKWEAPSPDPSPADRERGTPSHPWEITLIVEASTTPKLPVRHPLLPR